jgi:hypothetical protein
MDFYILFKINLLFIGLNRVACSYWLRILFLFQNGLQSIFIRFLKHVYIVTGMGDKITILFRGLKL